MKRQTILGALAALALIGFGFVSPSPAMAACSNIVAGASWPDGAFSQNCGTGSTADATTMHNTLANNLGLSSGNELRLAGVTYYLFDTPAAYAAQFPAGPAPATTDDFNVTSFDANKKPIFTAIFKVNGKGQSYRDAAHATQLAVGQAVDYLLGYVANGGIVVPGLQQSFSSTPDSATTFQVFKPQVDADWATLETLPKCGAGGIFVTRKDVAGAFICNNNGAGPGLSTTAGSPTHYASLATSKAILAEAWPASFKSDATVFAEDLASLNTSVDDIDTYITHFSCSRALVSTLRQNGTILTPSPAGCPTSGFTGTAANPGPVKVSACQKLFSNQPGRFPDGRVLNCDLTTVNGVGYSSAVMSGLNAINANIKQTFTAENSHLFVFTNATAYVNAFTKAGRPAGNFSTAAAGTYPDRSGGTTVWYTILFEATVLSQQEMVGVGDHEIGHVFDYAQSPAPSPQPSGTAAYDLAMQHDWLTLDFTDAAGTIQRLPCATAPYIGPLVSVTDPSSPGGTQQFCNGSGGLTNNAKYGGKRISVILRMVFTDPLNPINYQSTAPHIGPAAPSGYTTVVGWREWHAEAFGIRANINTVGTPYNPQFTQIMQNGYFACTAGPAGWAQAEYSTGAIVTAPPCQSAMPGGWIPIH